MKDRGRDISSTGRDGGANAVKMSAAITGSREHRIRMNCLEFCKAFASGTSGPTCLDRYFTADPTILEHGPNWANARLPFLGIPFTGRRAQADSAVSNLTCDDYFDRLTASLSLEPGSVVLPTLEAIAYDRVTGIATILLQARFTSVATGHSWQEHIVYVLRKFDDKEHIGRLDLWADALSAWHACNPQPEESHE